MHKLIEVMEKQLEIEKKSAEEKLTANNLDTIFKLTSVINNLAASSLVFCTASCKAITARLVLLILRSNSLCRF